MVLSIFFCMLFNFAGIGVSFSKGLSTGPTIIVIAGLTYLFVISLKKIKVIFKNNQ